MKTTIIWSLAALMTFISVTWSSSPKYRRICYYTNWSQYRKGISRFTTANITDPFLCTHIIYSFAKIIPENNTIGPYEWNDEGPDGYYKKMTALKTLNPDLKILLAVGGWVHGSAGFVHVVSTDDRISLFCENVYEFLTSRNFDGIDINWSYPAHRGSNDTDRERFTVWIKAMHDYFEVKATGSDKPRLLVSASVAGRKEIIDKSYEVAKISIYLDFISVTTFNFYDDTSNHLNHHSPTYGRAGEVPPNSYYNMDFVVKYFISEGTARDKLVVAIPFYSRTFKLVNSTMVLMRSPNNGSADPLRYNQICQLENDGWTKVWHEEHQAPYAYNDQLWIGYNDIRTMEVKANYIKDEHLGGFMAWELSQDDFGGVLCGQGNYPLLNKLKQVLTSSRDRCSRGSWGKLDKHGCMECPVGEYQPNESMTSCITCPDNKVTYSTGTESTDQCTQECGAGKEYDFIQKCCVDCPLNYYRDDTTHGYCHKCNSSTTTMSKGSVRCVPLPEGVTIPEPENISVKLTAEFSTKSCENAPVVFGAVHNAIIKRVRIISQRFSIICHKDCSNVLVSGLTGCGTKSRSKRAADDSQSVTVEITIENIPIELTETDITRTSESILTEAFLNRQYFSQLEIYGITYQGITSKQLSCVRVGYLYSDNMCYPCQNGSFFNETMTSCEPCPVGSYQDQSAQKSCTPCIKPLMTLDLGSRSSDQCVSPCVADVNYCVNGGICQFDASNLTVNCKCMGDFYGHQCKNHRRRGSNHVTIIGSAIGGAVVFLIVLIIVVVCFSHRRFKQEEEIMNREIRTTYMRSRKKPLTA